MINNLRKRYEQLQGLLNTGMNQSGGLLGNIPQGAILGSAIFGQGIQGRDPFSALLPAAMQTAQLQKYLTPKAKTQILSEKEKEDLKLPKNKQFQKDPNTGKISQIGGSQVEVNLGKPLTQGVSVANQYEKESKKFIDRNASRKQILALTDTEGKRSPQEDFDLVYAYYKFLDPGSTVRETEFENLERLGSVGRRIKKIIPKWTKGRLLTDSQVKEIRNSMDKQFTGFADEQKTRYNRFSTLLTESNLNPNLFLQNYIEEKTPEKQKLEEIDYSKLSNEELLRLYNQ